MSRWRAGFRLAGYLMVLVLSLAFAVALGVCNWQAARRGTSRSQATQPVSLPATSRLRFYVFPRTTLPRGARITPADLKAGWDMLPDGEDYIASARLSMGRYAAENLQPGLALRARQLQERMPFSIPPCGAVVSVQVKGDHATHLRPGMRLVFVAEKPAGDKPASKDQPLGPLPKPLWEHRGDSHNAKGLELLTVTAGVPAAGGAVLLVAVPNEAKDVIPLLAAGEWRPVVVFSRPQ